MGTSLDRRRFMLGSAAGIAALASPASARRSPAPARTLVLIQLSGGHDGLSMLAPYADDAYGRVRTATRLGASDVLRLDERVGLHPELGRLHALFGAGHLALIEGIGYPDPNRSHFRSLDIWHAADARGRGMSAGWIGRAVERLPEAGPETVVHFGPRPPFALHSAQHGPLCLTPMFLRAAGARAEESEAALASSEDAMGAEGDTLALVRTLQRETEAATERVRAALHSAAPRADYPGSAFAQDLRSSAALIHAGLGVRVCSVELDGFDTHRDQRKRHERLMSTLDAALDALWKDLQRSEAGRETLVVCFSEFGRRVAENGSGGTDHGAAGLAFALGTRVKGGLHGRPPALDALDDGDLAFTTDFRALYASCLKHVFELDPKTVLGTDHAPLALV